MMEHVTRDISLVKRFAVSQKRKPRLWKPLRSLADYVVFMMTNQTLDELAMEEVETEPIAPEVEPVANEPVAEDVEVEPVVPEVEPVAEDDTKEEESVVVELNDTVRLLLLIHAYQLATGKMIHTGEPLPTLPEGYIGFKEDLRSLYRWVFCNEQCDGVCSETCIGGYDLHCEVGTAVEKLRQFDQRDSSIKLLQIRQLLFRGIDIALFAQQVDNTNRN